MEFAKTCSNCSVCLAGIVSNSLPCSPLDERTARSWHWFSFFCSWYVSSTIKLLDADRRWYSLGLPCNPTGLQIPNLRILSFILLPLECLILFPFFPHSLKSLWSLCPQGGYHSPPLADGETEVNGSLSKASHPKDCTCVPRGTTHLERHTPGHEGSILLLPGCAVGLTLASSAPPTYPILNLQGLASPQNLSYS